VASRAVEAKYPDWNPDRLRKYKGLENLTDEQAISVISSLKRLAHILLSFYRQKKLPDEQPGHTSKIWQRSKKVKRE
jgi:hypothetical protein